MYNLYMRLNYPYSQDGLKVPGVPGIKGKRREQRLARIMNRVFELREQGKTKVEIAKELHMTGQSIEALLHDPDNVRRRLASYNEQLRAATPVAIRVVYEVLNTTAPNMLSERARMAQWVLENTKTVGKESPVNVFIKGGDTHITLTNDTLEAAKAVAAAMRAAPMSLPMGEVIDVQVDGGTLERPGVGLDPNGDSSGPVGDKKLASSGGPEIPV